MIKKITEKTILTDKQLSLLKDMKNNIDSILVGEPNFRALKDSIDRYLNTYYKGN